MAKKLQNQSTKDTQISDFRQAARELGCDESEANFARNLKAIAKAKPKAPQPKRRRPARSRA